MIRHILFVVGIIMNTGINNLTSVHRSTHFPSMLTLMNGITVSVPLMVVQREVIRNA